MSGCRIRVRGLVQGVGFRPYVWRLARELGLAGTVANDGAGVVVEAFGPESALAELLARLPAEAPRLARVDGVEFGPLDVPAPAGFTIADSGGGAVATAIGPDAAICPDCAADILDPGNRRWRYAFTTCTHCGPRYTVSRGIPYDRARTSLSSFPLCADCAAEYGDPADRRFHAETTACPACGPRLALLDATGAPLPGDPLAEAVRRLADGKILAIKGLGGFHLACDARNAAAVAELRERKQREAKPFAVMALNVASLVGLAAVGPAEAELLASRQAPIVLCPKGDAELPGIAPGLAWFGAMLPATPLHLLLWHEAVGRPAGTGWLAGPHPLLLVMTSANPHGEPLVVGNGEAVERLAGIADAFLVHDRDIVVRCDDSVVRPAPGGPAFLRRARGWTPSPIRLPGDGPAVLALGGYLKNTVCALKGNEAFLSQHVGSLDNAATLGFLDETVAHLLDILGVRPQAVAHDLHPDYASTHLALRLAAEWGVPALAVGHHHAHVAAVAAEHGVAGPLLGLAVDGVGLGPDGGLWGGELLRIDGADGVHCARVGHLFPLALPGGDRAAREPWRMAASALHACGQGERIEPFLEQRHSSKLRARRGVSQNQPVPAGAIRRLLESGLRCPATTSLGRLFDAAAGLLGTCAVAAYEGQAAMELEGLARIHGPAAPLPGGWRIEAQGGVAVLDFRPLLAWLADCGEAGEGAAVFHATLAAGLAEWALAAGCPGGRLALAGGCAQNALLADGLRARLARAGVELLEAHEAPPGDGGLALGQAWVARQVVAG